MTMQDFRATRLMNGSSVLVTGGAGYIGSHAVLALLDAGERAVVIDDLSTGLQAAVPEGVPFYRASCGDTAMVAKILQNHAVDTIMHFAGSISVAESVRDPGKYYLNNTVNTHALISQAERAGVLHFIFSSTAAVYGEPRTIPIEEENATLPINPYGRSKLAIEWMLRDAAASTSLRYCALRYFNVAGADPAGRSGQSTREAFHLIHVAVQAALGRRQGMDVFGSDYPTSDGSCIRDYVHVTDLAQAHVDALTYLRSGGESLTCNVGYGRGYSVLDVIDVVKRVCRVDFDVRTRERRPGDPAILVASNAKAKSILRWRSCHDHLEQIVQHALSWERQLKFGVPA
ncbi:UDP-glucose 4-epimerase [Bradyrhizobium algeriense]|uniref:UDP-glucose 4-epimerase n=1 Tax=Bradyrhizobium algeriense TaxID=634784 RepID=A0ABU8BH27_9BRAD